MHAPPPELTAVQLSQRMLQAQLAYAATSTGRGAYGVPILAAALSIAFCSIEAMGSIPIINGVAFTAGVTAWALAARLVVIAYRQRDQATRATPAWQAAFMVLLATNGLIWGGAGFLLWRPAQTSTISPC